MRPGDLLELLPAVVALGLLVIALASDGAFSVERWGPLGVTVLALLAFSPVRRVRGPALAAILAIWGFAAWTALSATWTSSPGDAVEGACRAALYAGLFTLPVATLPDHLGARRLATLLTGALCAFVFVVFALVCIRGDHLLLAGRLNAPVGYRNGTATLFVMAFWPLLCVAASRLVTPGARACAYSAATVALALAFLTQSRGAVLGFAVGGVVVLGLGPDRVRRAWLAIAAAGIVGVFSSPLLATYDAFIDKTDEGTALHTMTRALIALAVVSLVVMLLAAILDHGLRGSEPARRQLRTAAVVALALGGVVGVVGVVAAVGNPAAFAGDKLDEFRSLDAPKLGKTRLGSTGGQRYDLWQVAVRQFERAPLAGEGEGSYAVAYYRERKTDRNLSTAHSLPLTVLGELGLMGALLLTAFLASAGMAIARGIHRRGHGTTVRWLAPPAAVGAIFFGQALVDWLWLIPGLAGLAMLSLGIAVALATDADPTRPAPAIPRWPRLAAGAICALATCAVAALYLSDYETREARAQGAHGPQGQLAAARRAERLDPWALSPLLLRAGAQEALGRRADARRALHDALALEPHSFVVPSLLGDLEMRARRPAIALVWYRRALAANPVDVGLQQLAAAAAHAAGT